MDTVLSHPRGRLSNAGRRAEALTPTMLLLLGVAERAVMDIMGWSQTSMTTRYQHITPELTLAIANRVGDVFWT